jgi:hypothetical protein
MWLIFLEGIHGFLGKEQASIGIVNLLVDLVI